MYKLREIQRQDIPKINQWRNDSELIEYLGAPFRFINVDVDYKWFDNYMNNRNNTLRCSIVEKENSNSIIGLVSLTNINAINQSAVFHIMIGDQNNRGKGIGFFATMEILKHAFYHMNLNRIELTVLANNNSAESLYKKVGFKEEGIKRQAVYKNGQYVNMKILAILKEDFFNKWGKNGE